MIRKSTDAIGPLGQAAGFEADYSSLAAPLHIGDQPVGVITLAHHTPGRYGHEAQAMVATFASYAAVAIENARLYDAAQEQAYASAALLQVAQAVVSLNELDEILGTIVRVMPILVGVERVALYLWDAAHEMFHPAHTYGFDGEARNVLGDNDLGIGAFPLLDATRNFNNLLVHPLKAEETPEKWMHFSKSWPHEDAEIVRSNEPLLYAFPLSVKADVFGVLLLQETPDGRRFRRVVWKSLRALRNKPRLQFKMTACKKRWWRVSVSKRKFNWRGKSNKPLSRSHCRSLRVGNWRPAGRLRGK